MRLIETFWGGMFPRQLVKHFLYVSESEIKERKKELRESLFLLWIHSPEHGEMAAFIALKRKFPSPVRELAGEILIRGPVVERLTEEVSGLFRFRDILSSARENDDLIFFFKKEWKGLHSLSILWRRINDTLSVPAWLDEFIGEILKAEYLPGLRIPFIFSAGKELSARAKWLAPKIFPGVEKIEIVRRQPRRPFSLEDSQDWNKTKH